ncbi:sigma-70 family RNA polymerase sigma factor [Luteibacter sp. NPDC031894]|uniref:sigma-70 family RNA polymerase sigma factor n=1 Tax=Luteibacter sp. NPDC031894 TaxID=3390572 RepID=UPI003D038F3C
MEPHRGRLRLVGGSSRDQGFRGGGSGLMEREAPGDATLGFSLARPKLIRVAYRMLGSVSDAEDVVQEAYIRWMQADRGGIRKPTAFLHRTVTRLCLDQLKSARHQREKYVGTWLPEPLVEEDVEEDDITLPLMLALERLSPLERAAFLLHDVFGMEFPEVAQAIDRDPAACRQLAARARTHVREARPRYKVEKWRGMEIAQAFFAASRQGDMHALEAILAADVSIHADGGGKRASVTEAIVGVEAVMTAQRRLAEIFRENGSTFVRLAFINGLPGFVSRESDGELQTTAFDIEDGKIVAIYVVRNPDKLRHLH